jgi:GNAT superfamily N-acetyltransferase
VVQVVQIDPHDERAFDDWFAVLRATDTERWPDRPGWQRSERLAWVLDSEGPEEHRCLSATGDDGVVHGIADLHMFRRENLHLARLEVRVLPGSRRRGVGGALVGAAEAIARDTGRRELGGMDEIPVRAGWEDVARPFAEHLGFAPAMPMARRELPLPLAPAHRASLLADRRADPAGYFMITFVDRWPDEFMAARCELGRRMSTDIPMGDQELDEEVWDEARVRQIEALLASQGRTKFSTAARHDATGDLVAFTELVVSRERPEFAWQHDTLVIREHRGHGLGFATKLANVVRLVDAYPGVRALSTWNAGDNEHMIAINEAMGFDVVAHSTYWLKKLGA